MACREVLERRKERTRHYLRAALVGAAASLARGAFAWDLRPSPSYQYCMMLLHRFFLAAIFVFAAVLSSEAQTADELCAEENTAINSKSEIVDAFAAATETRSQRFSDCIASGQSSCTLFSESELTDLESVCEAAGADFEAVKASFECYDAFLNYYTLEYPYLFCFGYSCEEADIEADYTDLMIAEVNSLLEAGFVCDYSYERYDVDIGPAPSDSGSTSNQADTASAADAQHVVWVASTLTMIAGLTTMLSATIL
jgi:hypothetical protein